MTSAVPSKTMARSGIQSGRAPVQPVDQPVDLGVEHPRAAARGALLGLAITLPLAAAAAGVSYLMGSQQRSVIVAIGLAAGASMATQVLHRCHRAGVRATAVALLASVLAVLGMHVGVLAAEPGPVWPALVEHISVAGMVDVAREYVGDEPVRAAVSVGASLLLAYLAGRGLGACRFEKRAADAFRRD